MLNLNNLLKNIFILFIFFLFLNAKHVTNLNPIDFDTYKIGDNNGKTMLLLGGIQGDEPGGFNALNVFLMHYKVKNGSVIIIPTSNKLSMLFNHRGIYGDLNRKFAYLSPDDKEGEIIKKLKYLIDLKSVDLVFHLHDGSGFWRPTYISKTLNPNRWGNCLIIDQKMLENSSFGELEKIALKGISFINEGLINPMHEYHLNNTQTDKKNDKEMLKALTYYAIANKKPAFANEASKELTLPYRVYYHLRAIEYMLGVMGITFQRDFDLNVKNIYSKLYDSNLTLSMYQNYHRADLDSKSINIIDFTNTKNDDANLNFIDIKDFDNKKYFLSIPFFDLKKNIKIYLPLGLKNNVHKIGIYSKSSILGIIDNKDFITLKYGNRVITRFVPTYVKYDEDTLRLKAQIDNEKDVDIKSGDILKVNNKIDFSGDYDLFVDGKKINSISAISKLNSIDKSGKLYKVDIFKKNDDKVQAQKMTIVKVNVANIREKPKLDSKILLKAKNGMILESVENDGEWIKVKIYSSDNSQYTEGYILSNLVISHDFKHATVRSNIVNVRENPSLDSKVLAKIPRDSKVEVLDISNGWAHVSYNVNGKEIRVYIFASLLSFEKFLDKYQSIYNGSVLVEITKS